jgi:hypothetical protein
MIDMMYCTGGVDETACYLTIRIYHENEVAVFVLAFWVPVAFASFGYSQRFLFTLTCIGCIVFGVLERRNGYLMLTC